MPIVSRYPSIDTAVSGTWSSPTAVQVADGVVAATTLDTPSLTVERRQGGYGFDAVLPDGASITSVGVEVRHRVSTPDGAASLENFVAVGGTAGTVNADSSEPTALTTLVYDVSRPGGGSWTRADLLDGTFVTGLRASTAVDTLDQRVTEAGDIRITEASDVRISEQSVSTSTSVAFEWDYVQVYVTYTDTRLIVQVLQGNIIVATRYVSGLTATDTDYQFQLNPVELATITDASDLRVVVTAGATGQRISEAHLDLVGVATVVVDVTPPTLVGASPAAGASNVAITSNMVLTFSETIAFGTGTLVLRTLSGQTVETFTAGSSPRLSISGTTLTIDPSASLNYSTSYVLDIPAGAVRDLASNAFAGLSTYSFTTAVDSVGPTVLVYEPAIGGTGVSLNPTIALTFNEALQRGTGTIVLRTAGGTTVASFNAATSPQINIVGNVVTITPTTALTLNFIYYLDIPSGAFQDLQANAYAGTSTYNFATITQAVTVASFSPANGATGVSVLNTIVLTFNTNVRAGTGVLTLYAAPNLVIESFNIVTSQRIAFSGTTLTIDPTNALENGRVYYLTVPAGAVTDLAANPYIGTSSYSFTSQTIPGFGEYMPTAPKAGFWVALADSTHNKSAVEVQLSPAPSRVDYPSEPLGEIIETADGRVVTQQANRDPRRRGWVWTNFGPLIATYERQYRWLEGLRARQRQSEGQSPYIYVYDGTTNLLNKRQALSRPGASLNGARTIFTVADVSGTVVASQLVNATVDVYVGTETSARQRTVITAATNTTLSVDPAIDASLTGTLNLKINYLEPYWWRVRVLDTMRTPLEAGNMRYAESRLVFVIEDPNGYEVA